ncbi:TerC family protein [Paenibacillus chibensis]|uniref:TerC family protein n=1 Tax=Paenibacillus chibensis TaxID=59846 RepID=A0ABU6PZM5_9BACL|nr:TerC family protein [Paenibacillus chibensis]MEC0369920.1 TerC family protein [Paenibacillus chibensis]MED5020339.1 TerC family protein [Paenibacillus chibensis]
MEESIFAFLAKLINIVFLDLILAGDNAIVIGLAARNLPSSTQKKAIFYGTGGAVLLRIAATIIVVWLLQIPWLLLVGGILLIGIAYKLLADDDDHTDVKAGRSLWGAVRTIIVADAAMGLDNVIAVAGAAQQNILLVILGLLISVPIVVWGSTLFIKLIDRFPWIIYLGSAVLGYTASNMITEEKRLQPFFEAHPAVRILFIVVVIIAVLAAGFMKKRSDARKKRNENSYS